MLKEFPTDYRIWLRSRFFSNFAKQMQGLVLAWQVYQLTRDPLALGLIGLCEALPFLLVSLWAGHLIDRHDKRLFLMGAEAGLVFCMASLFGLSLMDKPPLALLYLVSGLIGICSSFENISATAYNQMIVKKEQFPKAAAWNLAQYQVAIISGPIVGGWIMDHLGFANAYLITIGSLVLSFIMAVRLRSMPPLGVVDMTEPTMKRVKEGLRFIKTERRILSAMSIDMIGVLFGDCVALLPVFAADILHIGPTGLGLLRASPAFGSTFLSMLQARTGFIKPRWDLLKATVFAFGLSIVAFALSRDPYLSGLFLALGGMADGTSVIIRQSIYQALTPDHLRGRVSAVNSIFISSSNELGAFESGFMAKLIGTVPSVVFGGCVTMITVGVMHVLFRDLNNPASTPKKV